MTIPGQPLDILVIGAGIAGLSAAIALGKQGHRVVLCPRTNDPALGVYGNNN
jgi:salicylate hydroxylase